MLRILSVGFIRFDKIITWYTKQEFRFRIMIFCSYKQQQIASENNSAMKGNNPFQKRHNSKKKTTILKFRQVRAYF